MSDPANRTPAQEAARQRARAARYRQALEGLHSAATYARAYLVQFPACGAAMEESRRTALADLNAALEAAEEVL